MTLNDDFSFVRFLKVVKTLYESSVFTQLGKTVGSALHYQPITPRDDTNVAGDKDSSGNSIVDDQTTPAVPEPSSMLCFGFSNTDSIRCQDALADTILPLKEKRGDRDLATFDSGEKRVASQGFLEQVMNCTLGHEDMSDDDDTFPAPSYDDGTYGDATTFDTDFDNESQAQRGNNSRRGC